MGIDQVERSATDIVNEALIAAVLDAVAAWKVSAGGLTNVLARELGAVHVNATAADLPKEVRAALAASVRDTFNRLRKEGYVIAKGTAAAPSTRPASSIVQRGSDRPTPAPQRPKVTPQVEVRRPKLPGGPKRPTKPR